MASPLLVIGLVAVHVLANVVWIGSLLAVALTLVAAPSMAHPAEVGMVALRVHRTLAVPAFAVSFAAGVLRLALAAGVYLHLPWMHAKLTFALVVIALHHVIGARAKRAATSPSDASKGMSGLALVTLIAAAGAVVLGVYKGFP
jgi:putative membrane protein